MKVILIILTLFIMIPNITIAQEHYALCQKPAPVLNSPDFADVFGGKNGYTLKLDEQGLIREIEFIALPGTVFELLGEYDYGSHKIFHAKCSEYDFETQLYIDSRFFEVTSVKPEQRKIILPSIDSIYKYLDEALGSPYCWGGNYKDGIQELFNLYPPSKIIKEELKNKWTLKGVDCSGLMYEATNGYTPRNTSKLVHFGESVNIENFSADEIVKKLKPLDMIVWNGHVIYVYDDNFSIQSGLSKGGVVKLNLLETIKEVMESRIPVNGYDFKKDCFVIRRWFEK